jgi:hypothetical protein
MGSIHEKKTRDQKSHVTVPLRYVSKQFSLSNFFLANFEDGGSGNGRRHLSPSKLEELLITFANFEGSIYYTVLTFL